MKWNTLKSEYIIRRPWLTARRDTVELPSGVVDDECYVPEYPTWINVTAVTTDGHMALIRQYRHGLDETCYEIVAGMCEEARARRPPPLWKYFYGKRTGSRRAPRMLPENVIKVTKSVIYALLLMSINSIFAKPNDTL